MTISIITVTFNNATTITDTIQSVLNQTIKPLEHIIIDGKSNDGTHQILQNYSHLNVISEPDNGMYDALNKGITLAKGDIIGIIHADDIYKTNTVLESVLKTFTEKHCDAVYGDLQYVKSNNINKVIRNWKAKQYNRENIKFGWMPPHPTFFVKKGIYEKYGLFDLSFFIASDYELMMRFLWKHNINLCYIPEVFVCMRTGGKSNKLKNIWLKMKEDYCVIKKYQIGGIEVLFAKNIRKITQFL